LRRVEVRSGPPRKETQDQKGGGPHVAVNLTNRGGEIIGGGGERRGVSMKADQIKGWKEDWKTNKGKLGAKRGDVVYGYK